MSCKGPIFMMTLMSFFELFLETIQNSFELCSSVKQSKKKNCKPTWFENETTNAISTNRQELRWFRENPTASNKTKSKK